MQISDLLTGLAVVIVALIILIFAATIPLWAEPKSKKEKKKPYKRSKQQMEKVYERISLDELKQLKAELSSEILHQDLIEKVVNIPENPTNKDVMCAFFGQVTLDKVMCIDPEWFNSPYGTGRKGATDETDN